MASLQNLQNVHLLLFEKISNRQFNYCTGQNEFNLKSMSLKVLNVSKYAIFIFLNTLLHLNILNTNFNTHQYLISISF